ncbi:e2f-associated phosphoprotein [Ectocarpus siliculosus]|uniref:E2f-associated phosphoprotein n=1 Tax=Ectocarpus siliculosus TaxID=2880 RepID=D8LQE6_ECTSI|nr:e2f-associated phosphoprotein [Ectocarpus siliculosus]|eukprot:CBN78710.1 e2f-associated phosphoprotein [Ectocarpus siliculosus]
MEVDPEPVPGTRLHENPSGGLDSDDETLRFDKDDDLYAEDLDEEDARWVRKQHLPATECEEAEDGNPPTGVKNKIGKGEAINGDKEIDEDEIAEDQPPTISDSDIGDGGPPAGAQKKQQGGSSNNQRGPMGVASDAQLSCPLCFTTVCLECQRHAKYYNQFRAVTGINVNINYDVFLTLDDVSGGGSRRRRGRRKGNGTTAAAASVARDIGGGGGLDRRNQSAQVDGEDREEEQETFHPVSCGECDHRVGVYDVDEVFHFFGVVASG